MPAVQSARAQIIERRTYLRPKGDRFETAEESWVRVIDHQRWLWERAKGSVLNADEEAELAELLGLFLDRKVTVSGRTRWLGGTDIAKTREASQFNCSFVTVRSVYDVVDAMWLLLQGCGVGFRAEVGVLNGFTVAIPEIEIVRSQKTLTKDAHGETVSDPKLKGCPENREWFDRETGIWHITVGDSAEAWAKFVGKLLAFKGRAKKLILDFSDIRPSGYRLSGYGWISSGDEQITKAAYSIFKVMNRSAGKLLTAIDILDILTAMGTILSSRRSAEIALYEYGGPEWKEFATAKAVIWDTEPTPNDVHPDWVTPVIDWKTGLKVPGIHQPNAHRQMSNNSLVFYQKPTRRELKNIFKLIEQSGGSEPGFVNGEAALKRAPYFKGLNPCAEILLGDKSFCNLVETILSRFNGDEDGLHRAHWLVARANYRQTCVNLKDGVLSDTWHELNEFLRLCGVGVTSIVGWEFEGEDEAWRDLREVAQNGAYAMADALGLPRPKLVTTVKPSGTQTKVSGLEGDELGEGAHKPLGKFIFNHVNFSKSDPMVRALEDAGYYTFAHPSDASAVIVRIPVEYATIPFDVVSRTLPDGRTVDVPLNLESAIDQLNRYRRLQRNYVDHNCSITISYGKDEVADIVDWLLENWDDYVGVSFVYRNDPSKTAEDLGYSYLPQAVVDEDTFRTYADTLRPVNFDDGESDADVDTGEECATGACPIR